MPTFYARMCLWKEAEENHDYLGIIGFLCEVRNQGLLNDVDSRICLSAQVCGMSVAGLFLLTATVNKCAAKKGEQNRYCWLLN